MGILGGINAYQYCQNPVNWMDPLGLFNTQDRGFEALVTRIPRVDAEKIKKNIAQSQQGRNSSNFGEYSKMEGKVQEHFGIWPPNSGAYGPIETVTLKPGMTVDRYGLDTGYYMSPEGIAFEQRALPSSSLQKPYTVYEILKPIENVSQSKILPWFGQPGQGIQYKLSMPVKWYVDNGYLKEAVR